MKTRPCIRVLNLISTLDMGGAETFLCRLVTSQDKTECHNIVVSLTGTGPVGKIISDAGIPVFCLGMTKGCPDIRGIFRLHRIISQYQPDIVHCWMYHANLLGLTVKPFFPGMRVLWNIRCSHMAWGAYGRVYDMTVRAGALLSRLPDGVVFNSFAGQLSHEELGYRNKNQKVIQNGIDTHVYGTMDDLGGAEKWGLKQSLGIPDHGFVITCVARFDPMKDHLTLFKAAARVLEQRSDAHFVFAGRGMTLENPALQSWMRGMQPKENLHLLGERSDIPQIYGISDLACLSSISEGFPNVIAEAMATGVPCVVTDAGDSAMMVRSTGQVVPVQQPEPFAAAILSFMDMDSSTLLALGKKAARRVHSRFNLIHTIARYETIYRSLSRSI
jgi:glycosyltransferase involved in cell wall biosynthesis